MALPSSLPICLPPSLSSVSWGQSMTGLLRAMGHISSIKKEQYRRSHHPVPYLPYRLLGSHFTSGWEITSEFGKLSSLHLSWLERHKGHQHQNLLSLKPDPIQQSLWPERNWRVSFPAPSTDIPVQNKNLNTWTYRQLHFNTVDQKYECNKILYSKPRFWILLSSPLI